MIRTISILAALLALAACNSDPAPAPVAPGSAATEPMTAPSSAPASAAAGSGIADALDAGALNERTDPERLLHFYANAVRIGDWTSAARAWTLDAQMTPEKLEAQFGGAAGPKLAVGKGDTEGAAGSLYYEAPIVVSFADSRPESRGTIVLRRANDVPGASEEQLVWRIERSSTVPQ